MNDGSLQTEYAVIKARFAKRGADMAKKTVKLRPWTATEVYKLKSLAKKKSRGSENCKSIEADNSCG
jgi:hypothetical protein